MSLLVGQARKLFGYGVLDGNGGGGGGGGSASASVVGGAMSVSIDSSNERPASPGKLSLLSGVFHI